MIRTAVSLFFAGVAAASLAGCAMTGSEASTPSLAQPPHDLRAGNDFASLVYLAAETLADRAEGLDKTRPVVVATVVSVDDLSHAGTFGKLASELVSNRIQQRGFTVREVTYMRGVETREPGGVFVLSRDARKLADAMRAQAVVAGTYAVGGEMIYLSLRLLSTNSGEVISSADVAIPLNENTGPLVNAGSVPLDEYQSG